MSEGRWSLNAIGAAVQNLEKAEMGKERVSKVHVRKRGGWSEVSTQSQSLPSPASLDILDEEEEADSEDDNDLVTLLKPVEEPTETDWGCVLNPGLTGREQECVRSLNDRMEQRALLDSEQGLKPQERPMKLLWNEELWEAAQPVPQPKNPNDVWWCTDLKTLKAMVMQERTEQLGLACCRHLEVWERTCGGREFMFQGMPALWKDPTESPKKLLELRTALEYRLDEEREKAYADLVMEELK
jgi:hypothetical protein